MNTKLYSLKSLRETLTNNSLIEFRERPYKGLEGITGGKNEGFNLAYIKNGYALFHIWLIKPSQNIDYLNKVFSNILPGITIIEFGKYGAYQHFKFNEERKTLCCPHFKQINLKVGEYYEKSEVIFIDSVLLKKFKDDNKEFFRKSDIEIEVKIFMHPSKKLSEIPREDIFYGIKGELLDELPNYNGQMDK